MIKECEKPVKLRAIIDASKDAKNISDISRITSISPYYIKKLLNEFPGQKIIVDSSLEKNRTEKRLTAEQQEIFDMFMQMAQERKKCYITSDAKDNKSNLLSLPLFKRDNKIRVKLRNDIYNNQKVVRPDNNFVISNSPILRLNDNIYSIQFFFNEDKRNVLIFKHLRVINFNKCNNAEIVYYKKIHSTYDISKTKRIYRQFIENFINNFNYRF